MKSTFNGGKHHFFWWTKAPKMVKPLMLESEWGGPTEDHHHQQRLAPGLPGLAGVPCWFRWMLVNTRVWCEVHGPKNDLPLLFGPAYLPGCSQSTLESKPMIPMIHILLVLHIHSPTILWKFQDFCGFRSSQKRYLYTDEFEISMEIVCTSVPGGKHGKHRTDVAFPIG